MVGITEPCRLQNALDLTTPMLAPRTKVIQFKVKWAIMDNIMLWHQAKSFDHMDLTNDRLKLDDRAMICSVTNQAKGDTIENIIS